METSKFSFSIKNSSGKSGSVNKSNSIFIDYEENERNIGIKSRNSNQGNYNKVPIIGKRTQITSFSNIQSETEEKNDEDNDFIIECKNSLKSSKNINNIEILLNKKNSLKNINEDNLDSSTKKDSFRIPVDKFGIAMLRGMGYNPEIHNTKPKIFKKRNYNQSGLGAEKEIENISKK